MLPPRIRDPRRTVADLLRWSYANLAMAHAAVVEGASSYAPRHYAIRSKIDAGLRNGTMAIGPLADDERLKLVLPLTCCYCAAQENLTADHLVPTSRGGPDAGDNLVRACRPCNSSKGARDALAWYERRGEFPPLLMLRRYLKLAFHLLGPLGVLEQAPDEVPALPIDLARIPVKYPPPSELRLWVAPL
jgi:hypothetical protein